MRLPKPIFYVISALYPVLVFACLVLLHVPVRIFSLFVIVIAAAYFLVATQHRSKKTMRLFVSSGLLLAAGFVCLITGSALFLKCYPVVISAIFL